MFRKAIVYSSTATSFLDNKLHTSKNGERKCDVKSKRLVLSKTEKGLIWWCILSKESTIRVRISALPKRYGVYTKEITRKGGGALTIHIWCARDGKACIVHTAVQTIKKETKIH